VYNQAVPHYASYSSFQPLTLVVTNMLLDTLLSNTIYVLLQNERQRFTPILLKWPHYCSERFISWIPSRGLLGYNTV